MDWLQSPIFLAIAVVMLVGLLVLYMLLRKARGRKVTAPAAKPVPSPEKIISKDIQAPPGPAIEKQAVQPPSPEPVKESLPLAEEPLETADPYSPILSPDINLLPDIILNPGDDTVLLILPEHVPAEEVKKFEEFLRKSSALKIVTTGGSSDEGSNIGIRVLNQINLTRLLDHSNMSIVKHLRKKGERIVISLKSV